MPAPKLDTYETRDLHDGRWGLFKNGLCIFVTRDPDEIRAYFSSRRPGTHRLDQDEALGRIFK